MSTRSRFALVLLLSLLPAGCAGMHKYDTEVAIAELQGPSGQPVGTARFTQAADVLRVVVEASGLPPGLHAVHVHSVGRCYPPGFDSAGDHFNPFGRQHGALNPAGSHAGDLPNLTISANGTGRLEATTVQLTLGPGPHSVWDGDGSALVIHSAPDDFKTDPTGNAGARIACGVLTKPPAVK